MISSAFSFTRSSSRPHFHCVTARPSQKACSVERASPIRSRNPSRTSLVVSSENDHHPPLVNSRWPGDRVATHIYLVGKSTSRRRGCRLCVGGGKDSISLLFHCAVAWPLWPPVAKICSISPRDRAGGFRHDKTPICGCGALALVVLLSLAIFFFEAVYGSLSRQGVLRDCSLGRIKK